MTKEFIEFQPHFPEFAPSPLVIPKKGISSIDGLMEYIEENFDNIAVLFHQNPPVDIIQLLDMCRIAKLSYEDLQGQGYLDELENLPQEFPNYFIIDVRKDMSEEEKRFTITHELGHLVSRELQVKNTIVIGYQENEDIADRIARTIIAPRKLIIPEFNRISNLDPLSIFAILYGEFQMPPYELAKRMIHDLDLLQTTFVITKLNARRDPEKEWIFSKENRLENSSFGKENNPHQSYPLTNNFKFRKFRDSEELEPDLLDNIYILTRDMQDKDWINVWESQAKGITVGKEFYVDEERRGISPEFAVFTLRLGERIAQVRDISYLNPYLKRQAINLISDL